MWKFTNELNLIKDRKLLKILEFYLFECPVEGKSYRGKTFSQLGWSGHKLKTLKSELLRVSSSNLKKRYHPVIKDQLEEFFIKYQLLDGKKIEDETIVFLKWDEKRIMESLFSAIRNAFAHGSFKVVKGPNKTKKYYLMNHDKYIKAILIINEETLLNWITVIKK